MATATVATERADVLNPDPPIGHPPRRLGGKGQVILLDVASVVLGMLFASVIYLAEWGTLSWEDAGAYLLVCAASVPVWVFGFARNRLYSARFITRGVDESRRVVRGVFTGVLGLALASVAFQKQVERGWLLLVFLLTFFLVGAERSVMRRVFERRRISGRMQRRVMIFGDNEEAHELYSMLMDEPRLGYLPVAMIASPLRGQLVATESPEGESARLDDEISRILDDLHAARVDSVLVAASSVDLSVSNVLIRALSDAGIHVELSSTLLDVAPERLTVRPLGGFPIVYLEPVRHGGWRAMAKRSFDIATAATALVITAPVVFVAAVAVKLTSSGPAFSSRCGWAEVARSSPSTSSGPWSSTQSRCSMTSATATRSTARCSR